MLCPFRQTLRDLSRCLAAVVLLAFVSLWAGADEPDPRTEIRSEPPEATTPANEIEDEPATEVDPELDDEADPSVAKPPSPGLIYLLHIAQKEEDLAQLLQRLDRPDFFWVLLPNEGKLDVQALRDRIERAEEMTPSEPAGVTGVEVSGTLADSGGVVELTVTYQITTSGPEAQWVPIGLNGLNPREATNGPRELPLRNREESWEVEVSGAEPGLEIPVEVGLQAPIQTLDERRVLELVIPLAASTRIVLEVPGEVVEAMTGDGLPVDARSLEGGEKTRLKASLSPRSSLELSWLPVVSPGETPPPLLRALGDIVVEVNSRSFLARSTWVVQSWRGTAEVLTLQLDPDEDLIGVELDGQTLSPTPIEGPDGIALVEVPLTDPLRQGEAVPLVVTTRRPLDPEGSDRFQFRGHPLDGMAEQSGFLAIPQAEGLRIVATPQGRLDQIAPKDLSQRLRGGQSIALAYRFSDQPFALDLRVDPAPPRVRSEASTSVSLTSGHARVDTWLDYRVIRGRVFHVDVSVPDGLELDPESGIGPPNVVADWQPLPIEEAEDRSPRDSRLVRIQLTEQARSAPTFRLELTGRHVLDLADELAMIPLFTPVGVAFGGGRLIVRAPRHLSVEPLESSSGAGWAPSRTLDDPWTDLQGARSGSEQVQAQSSWPTPVLWLRNEAPVPRVALRVEIEPKVIHLETDLTVRLDRERIEVEQRLDLSVRHDTLREVEIAVPASIERRWELVDRVEVAEIERLGQSTPDGPFRHRLVLVRELTDAPLRLVFRYPLLSGEALPSGDSTPVPIRWITPVLKGSSAPVRVRVEADPSIDLEPEGDGWALATMASSSLARDGSSPGLDLGTARYFWVQPGSPEANVDPEPRIIATPMVRASLPRLVASRLRLSTIQGPEGEIQASAWYRVEAHESTMAVALPPGSELVQAFVDGRRVVEETLREDSGIRLRFPDGTPDSGVIVALEYRLPASAVVSGWGPPRLLEEGLVQQTLWEVSIPWNRALVGVPDGWVDENRWYWAGYVWKRRPWLSSRALRTWITGPGPSPGLPGSLPEAGHSGFHSYLFGRPGEPVPLRPTIASRALLVGLCSGVALGLGLIWLAWRPRWGGSIVAVAVPALVVAVAIAPASTLLALQSSALGWGLALLAALTRRFVERRHPAGRFGERSGLGSLSSAGSGSAPSPILVGSDDSTAIRPRPTTGHSASSAAPISSPAPGPVSGSTPWSGEVIDIVPPISGRESVRDQVTEDHP